MNHSVEKVERKEVRRGLILIKIQAPKNAASSRRFIRFWGTARTGQRCSFGLAANRFKSRGDEIAAAP